MDGPKLAQTALGLRRRGDITEFIHTRYMELKEEWRGK